MYLVTLCPEKSKDYILRWGPPLLPAFLPFFSRRQPLQGLCILPASHVQFLCLVAPLSPFSNYISTCYSLWNFKGKKSPSSVWVPNMESVSSSLFPDKYWILRCALKIVKHLKCVCLHLSYEYSPKLFFNISLPYCWTAQGTYTPAWNVTRRRTDKAKRKLESLETCRPDSYTSSLILCFCGLVFLVILIIFKLFLLTCLTSHWNILLVSRNKRFAHR